MKPRIPDSVNQLQITGCWSPFVDCVAAGGVWGFEENDAIMEEIRRVVDRCRRELGYDREEPERDVVLLLKWTKRLGEQALNVEATDGAGGLREVCAHTYYPLMLPTWYRVQWTKLHRTERR